MKDVQSWSSMASTGDEGLRIWAGRPTRATGIEIARKVLGILKRADHRGGSAGVLQCVGEDHERTSEWHVLLHELSSSIYAAVTSGDIVEARRLLT